MPVLPEQPSQQAPPASQELLNRPVYDPFTARRRRAPEWLINYTMRLVASDAVAAGLAGLLAFQLPVPGAAVGVVGQLSIVGAWPLLVAVLGGYAERRLGTGVDEYRRLLVAGLVAAWLLGLVAVALPVEELRPVLLAGAPVAVTLSLLGRAQLRRRLHRARSRGLMTKRVVVVGRERAVLDVIARLSRDLTAGLTVVGVCIRRRDRAGASVEGGIPVLGGLKDVVAAVDRARADAVVVASASGTAGTYLRELSWQLEGTNIEVLCAPGLIEVAPERLQVRPTATLPLIQVLEPSFRGPRRLVKAVADRGLALAALVLVLPVMLVIALAIAVTSRGPVFYRQSRIGKHRLDFQLLKFRSMAVDADRHFDTLMTFNEGNDVQFKLRRDPRVTRVGAILRRTSLDELPQLINVVKGDMSLVGPRPHVTREVDQYGPEMHRRLLVKPGITGLWQVSGRSNLSWAESVELDVRYVENWSLGLDLAILRRTFGAVLRGSGAY